MNGIKYTELQFRIGMYSFLFSAFILYAWGYNIDHFTADSDSMKMSTALTFAVLSLPLILKQNEKFHGTIQLISQGLVLLSGSWSIISIYQPLGISNFGQGGNPIWQLMSPSTATCFILLAFSQLLLISKLKYRTSISQWTLHLVSTLSLISILIHMISIGVSQRSPFYATMSAYTSILLLAQSIAYSLNHPEIGITGLLLGKNQGSKLAKKSLPIILLIYMVITTIILNTYYSHNLNPQFALISLSIALLFVAITFVTIISHSLNEVDQRKGENEKKLFQANSNLEEKIREATSHLSAQNLKLESFYKALDQSSLVSITDKYGIITEVNERFCKISQYSREELVGQNHRIISSNYHNGAFWHELWKTISNGHTWRGEIRNKAKDGSFYWVDTAICPIKDQDNNISNFLSIRQDITANKNIVDDLTLTTEILNEAQALCNLGGWQLDVKTGKTIWTDEVYNIYEVPQDFDHNKVEGISFYHPDYQETIISAITESIQDKKKFKVDCKFITAKKNQRWVRVSGKPIFVNGEVVKLAGVIQDITEEVRAKRELEETKSAAIAASKAKSEFIANMSHEIRTPLNGVIGFSDILLKSELTTVQREHMNLIQKSGQCLLDVINDILDFSKIEAGKLDLTPERTDLQSLIEGVTQLFGHQANSKSLEFILNTNPIELPANIWVDEVRLRQILINLLSNAIKFTETGEIELSIKKIKSSEENCTLRFAVRDTGIGISNEAQNKIFGAFNQADGSTTRKYGGTGLGLSISRSILNMMGSDLQLESQIGIGSNFFFDINVQVSDNTILENIPEVEISSALVVDDNLTNLNVLKNLLSLFSIQSVCVQNGMDAIETLKKNDRFDVIFMDYQMPEMNGIETIKKIKHEKLIDQEKCKLVLFQSTADDHFKKQIKSLKIDQYITKPLNIEKLSACLRSLGKSNKIENRNDNIKEGISLELPDHKTIMIAEDNAVNMILSVTILNRLIPDARIIEVPDGLEGIKAFKKEKIDLVFTDIQMGKMNGYDMAKAIRQIDQKTPIIALTAGTVAGEKQRCLEAGMNDMLTKPMREDQIAELLKEWFITKPINVDHQLDQLVKESNVNLDHFNLPKMMQVLGDLSSLNRLIKLATSSLNRGSMKMEILLKSEKMVEVHRAAHKLHGIARSVYLNRLNELLEEFRTSDHSDVKTAKILHEKIKSEIEHIVTIEFDSLIIETNRLQLQTH
ncbi:response regulator [Reichenbachiella ulvae]|uniref:histidine kinase n=1 Tax=Reichenbachiella ulvae TaxID=2980104 RepID=A0ABT3CYR3_9BACT|nr:response regulator [Reichenbachiella ulvae]MCV9388840.1 response regulator [Reichenbachiella ulvae]